MSETIDYFGLTCPRGGDFFICEGYANEFIGCCKSSPCNDVKGGVCAKGDLQPASFAPDKYDKLLTQDCTNASTRVWWTCAGSDPPFVGCCASNPCAQGSCPTEDLLPSRLTTVTRKRQSFLFPNGNATAANATAANSTAPTEGSSSSGGGLSSGVAAGITVAVCLVVMAIVAFLTYRCGQKAGQRKSQHEQAQSMVAHGGHGPDMATGGARPFSHYPESHQTTPTFIGGYGQASPKPSGYSHVGEYYPSPETQHRFSNMTAVDSRGSLSPGFYHRHSRQHSGGGGASASASGIGVQRTQQVVEMDGDEALRHELSAGHDGRTYHDYPPAPAPEGNYASTAFTHPTRSGPYSEPQDAVDPSSYPVQFESHQGQRLGQGQVEAGEEPDGAVQSSHPLGIR